MMSSAYHIHQFVSRHALEAPGNMAVCDEQAGLTYAELDSLSDGLAFTLTRAGVAPRDRVVICMNRSVDYLLAILGILKAGGVYVPLDRKTPRQRWHKMLADCSPRIILTDVNNAALLQDRTEGPKSCPILVVNQEALPAAGDDYPRPPWEDDDTVYIMYTSGSRGVPKGVMVTNRNVRTYVDWALDDLALSHNDRVLGTAPFHFDMSIFDVFATLAAGATLYIASEKTILFPQLLAKFIEQHEVTCWKGVSSLLMYMTLAGVIVAGRMPSLKTVLFAGEPLSVKSLKHWMNAFPEKTFINAYGPTEATGVSLCHKLESIPVDNAERIPIGRPCRGATVFLLKEDMTRASAGECGELCISGHGLAKGYLNDPQKTSRAFVTTGDGGRFYRTGDLARLREDGCYEFVTRLDDQVKIMGYRIELGEIEHALSAVNGVHEVAVMALQAASGDALELTAFLSGEDTLQPDMILSELKETLPAYMLPKHVRIIPRMPRTDRGKIDKHSLAVTLNRAQENSYAALSSN